MTEKVKHTDRLFRRQRSRCYHLASQDALLERRQENTQQIVCIKMSLEA